MNKPSNNRSNTISQPKNAASVNELSSEAMDDINSIGDGPFSSMKPSHNKRSHQLPSLDDFGSLPPLEDNRNISSHRSNSFDSSAIEIDDLSFDDDTIQSYKNNKFARRQDLDDDSNIIDINLEMEGFSAENRQHNPALISANEQFEDLLSAPQNQNNFNQELPPFSALDRNAPHSSLEHDELNNFAHTNGNSLLDDSLAQEAMNNANYPFNNHTSSNISEPEHNHFNHKVNTEDSSMLPPFVNQQGAPNSNMNMPYYQEQGNMMPHRGSNQSFNQNIATIKPQNISDPFSDPAFLAAQTAKPSFYQDQKPARSYQRHEDHDLGYISPGKHNKNHYGTEHNEAESFVFNKEEVERRTQEIWGHNNPEANQFDPSAQLSTEHTTVVEHDPTPVKELNADYQNNEQPVRLLNPEAPSTLINGYIYDLQNKSQSEVRSGLDRIIQKTSQAMIANQDARAHSHDGSILASDMFKGSRYEHNISEFNRNHQVNTKISGLVAKYNASKNNSKPNNMGSSNQAPQLRSNHSPNNQGDVSTVISQSSNIPASPSYYESNQIPQTAYYAGKGSKNYKTIMSDSNNRLVSADNFGRTSLVTNDKESSSVIDFSFGSKQREPSSVTANSHTQITKFGDERHANQAQAISPTVNLDSMLMPAAATPPSSSDSKGTKSTNVDMSSFNFDLDKGAANLTASTLSQVAYPLDDNNNDHKNVKAASSNNSHDLDILLPSLDDDLQDQLNPPRCKLFDAPDLFESSQDNIKKDDGPIKIKPDFYTTSNNKPAIVDINPLENPNEISTKVDHKNLDMELPELKDDKSLHSFESLSGLKDLGQALRSLADSLQPHQSNEDIDFNPLSEPLPSDPKFKISTEAYDTPPIDAFSSLMASADERFGNNKTLNKEAKVEQVKDKQPEPQIVNPAPVETKSSIARDSSVGVATNMSPQNVSGSYLAKAKGMVGQCQYLQHSGLDLATIERFNLGFDPFYHVEENNPNQGYMPNSINWQALIIPLSQDSFVAYNSANILQNPTGEPERRYVGSNQCFNLQLLNGSVVNKPLFICSNELDALALESLGCHALALGIPYNVMMVLTCLQNLCANQDIKNIIQSQCYLCLPNNDQNWYAAQQALVSAFQTLQLPLSCTDLTCSCPSIYQALIFNKTQLLSNVMAIQGSYSLPKEHNATINIAPSALTNTKGLVLSLESLAKLEISNTLYALSSSSIALSRLVLASLIENKFRPLVYAGSTMQWQMLCSLLSSQQGLVQIVNSPLKQLLGYKAKFLEMPWEMNVIKIDEVIRAGLQAQANSQEGAAAFMIDTSGYDQSLCTSLAPRFAQLAMEFNTPIVVWCTQEQKSIFSGNAFQSIEMAQGSPNEIIFRTIDNACRLHMFSTGK